MIRERDRNKGKSGVVDQQGSPSKVEAARRSGWEAAESSVARYRGAPGRKKKGGVMLSNCRKQKPDKKKKERD